MIDLLDRYMDEEATHFPLILTAIDNKAEQTYAEFHSNLFNFYLDFIGERIVIEDECGLFLGRNGKRRLELALDLCAERLRAQARKGRR